MKKLASLVLGFLIALAMPAGAIVSGLLVHNHSSPSLGGTSLAPSSFHPTGAPATCFTSIVASGGGDQIRLMPFAAGSGGQVDTLNAACSDYTPLNVAGESITFSTRTGVGTTSGLMTLSTGGSGGSVTINNALTVTGANALPGTFINTAGNTIIRSTGGNGYGAIQLEGSGANGSHAFFYTGGAEVARITGVSGGSMILSTGAGATQALSVSGGNTTVAGTLSSTKACATNFVRKGPNLCMREDGFTNTAFAAGCNAVTLPAAGATALLYQVRLSIFTANGVSFRGIAVDFGPASCTAITSRAILQVREEVATVSTNLAETYSWVTVPVISGAVSYNANVGVGGANILEGQIRGYYD